MRILSRLKAAAGERNVRFVLVGGHAVNFHGYARTTSDLDVLICKDDREAWLDVATGLGYQLEHDGGTFLQMKPAEVPDWPLDLLLVNRETFDGISQAAASARVFGEEVPMASLRHLLALKLHALKHTHAGRVMKDFEDVTNLIQINRLDPASDEFRKLCLKYGNAEIHGRIVRALQD